MKCKWKDCENESRTKSEFCSDTCSKRFRRNPDRGKSDTQPGQSNHDEVVAWVKNLGVVEDTTSPDAPGSTKSEPTIAKRTRTEGCKVAIPGDEDYTGCVVNGQVVTPEPTPAKDMTRTQLEQAIKAYPYDQWVNSPEHKELLHRLSTRSVAELEAEGYHIPCQKVSA